MTLLGRAVSLAHGPPGQNIAFTKAKEWRVNEKLTNPAACRIGRPQPIFRCILHISSLPRPGGYMSPSARGTASWSK